MAPFLEAFFPNFASTVLGVVLGLPVALYVNRRLTESQRAMYHAEKRKVRDDSANVLIAACEYNAKVLERMKELTLTGEVLRNPDLRSTTWEVVNHMFSPQCPDPVLLQKLSHHWLRLRRLENLNDEMFARVAGVLPAIPDDKIVLGMWGELHGLCASLHAHAGEIIGDLETLKTMNIDGTAQTLKLSRAVLGALRDKAAQRP